MIPKECKRLAEVDFPIAEVSKHSAREKSIRHGHPSTLHLWWARRPLASCRAMLMALLLPDPHDEHCPDEFKAKAKEILLSKTNRPTGWANEVKTPEGLRKVLLKFIGDFANWDNCADKDYLETARALIKAAHPEETPLVVDPFAGGGSIPLEALRVGCETFASDLNPVACLILKVMLEDIPRYGSELAEELRRVGKEIKEKAEKELAEFYPKDPDGATPIAYLWARTVKCESPNCGSEIPLMRSFWLCKKANRKWALRYKVVKPKSQTPIVEFEIFEPKTDKEVPNGTVTRAKATCLCCGRVLTPERVRVQLSEQRGGADVVFDTKGKRAGGSKMLAVVTLHLCVQGRNYRLPTEHDYQSVWKAQKRLKVMLDEWECGGNKGLCPVPDEPIAMNEIRRVSVPLYGATTWGDIFTRRQKQSLYTYAQAIRGIDTTASCSRLCSLALDRLLILLSAHCRWKPTGESLIDMFGRHAIGMVWDFAESTPGFGSENTFGSWIDRYAALVEFSALQRLKPGQIQQSDATKNYLPDESCQVWFTDPPYYDSIPYAHLSDCFYVWLKRSLPETVIGFSESLCPKEGECVVDRPHRLSNSIKDEEYFERKIGEAANIGRKVLSPLGCGSIVFAHKTTEGWEALLSGIIGGGWCITASWPIATELSSRLNARDTASLSTSVHLVCRPRSEDAPVGDWVEVLRELPNRVGSWMERLQGESIRGADLVFACIGPALEVFSRYQKVEKADGREVKLAEYLEKVWEVVGRMALEQILGTEEAQARNGAAGALEEDARLTALFLWTLQSTNGQGKSEKEKGKGENKGKSEKEKGKSKEIEENEDGIDEGEEEDAPKGKAKGYSLVFDVARRFAQPLGIDLPKWENRIIKTEKGVVRLLPVSERAKQLFGEEGAKSAADWIERDPVKNLQRSLFPELEVEERQKAKGKRKKGIIKLAHARATGDKFLTSDFSLLPSREREATTLDRVHAAMLLQADGQTNALRSLIKAEQDRSPDFLRLANALSALYPKGSEEKRLLDAMLLAVPR
jgi:adenine-specific DNA methylase